MINRISRARTTLLEAERQVSHAVDVARRWRPGLHRFEEAIVDHPKTSLVAALAAGVVLGWIIKRR